MGIWDKMEQLIGQGVDTSRELFARAKDKAQELGEMGLLKYEIAQLEKHSESLFARLGMTVYDRLVVKGQATVSKDAVKELLADLEDVKRRIEQKEGDLAGLKG
jgi:CelD/BcsL family acetyltransferase involved in cellulose biosynthesis